jgi:tetratricopeptide (TPR) repeat protein
MKQKKIKKEHRKNKQESVNTMQQLHQAVDTGEGKIKINKKYNLLFILAIFITGIIAYSNSFGCSFHFDDVNVFNSSVTVGSANIGDWLRSFPNRPIGILTFALNYYFHGLDVWGYHLVNLIIHLTNAFLVWWLTWLTLSTPVMKNAEISRHKTIVAFLTGMLFVTHPLATQSVTYIVQRFASLATLFYLLSLILFVQGKLWQGDKNIPWFLFGGSIVCALLGMLTKEIVFTLPFTIFLYDYCFLKTAPWKLEIKDKGLIISFIMLVIFILLFFGKYSLNIFDPIPPDRLQGYSYSISMKEYFLTQFQVILTYIRLFILPINQNLDYDYQISTSFFQMKTFFSFSLLLGILATGVLLFKKYRLISFGIFWFFLTMSVESSIIPISQNVIFEHRTYLPSFGFFLALTSVFFYFFKERYLKIAVIIILMFTALNTVLTYERNKIWKNEYTLWADCIKKSPNKARVNNNFGIALSAEGKNEEAIDYYNKAIQITPDFAEAAYNNRGAAYAHLGQYQRAIDDCNKAVRLKPDDANAYINRGLAYASLRQYERAITDYNEAIRLKPNYAEAYSNRGAAYAYLGQHQRAIDDYNEAIRLKPDSAEAYNNRGIAYANLRQYERAITDYNEAIRLKPDYAEAYSNRGAAYAYLGQHRRAIDDYNEAIRLKPDSAEAYNNRGIAYASLRQYERAITDYNEAIRLKPDYANAHYNRGNAYYNLGQHERAIEDYNKAIRLKPDDANAYINRGVAYFIQGNNNLGCHDAQKACAMGACKTLDIAKVKGYCR